MCTKYQGIYADLKILNLAKGLNPHKKVKKIKIKMGQSHILAVKNSFLILAFWEHFCHQGKLGFF